MAHLTITVTDEKGNTVGVFLADEKNFATGSRGFYGQSKLAIGEKRYQTSCQLVEIGSKPQTEEQKKASQSKNGPVVVVTPAKK